MLPFPLDLLHISIWRQQRRQRQQQIRKDWTLMYRRPSMSQDCQVLLRTGSMCSAFGSHCFLSQRSFLLVEQAEGCTTDRTWRQTFQYAENTTSWQKNIAPRFIRNGGIITTKLLIDAKWSIFVCPGARRSRSPPCGSRTNTSAFLEALKAAHLFSSDRNWKSGILTPALAVATCSLVMGLLEPCSN